MTDDTEPAVPTDEQHEDSLPTSVREGLRDATVPLATTDPGADAADLAPVGARLADADVVGLGEATHGTREFFELKHRILRHLVVDHGVRAVAMEANLPETMALNEYVVHGEGDLRDVLAGPVLETWGVESILAMVEWLREYNATRPPGDRVACFGFGAHFTNGAVERLRDHLDEVDPDFHDEVEADLTAVDDELLPPIEVDDVPERVAAAERLVPTLRTHLDDHRAAHVAATSEQAWSRARRYVAVIEQVIEKTEALDAQDGEEFRPTDHLLGLPGRAMADNVAWIRDYADADTLVVWAHDAHLNRVAYTGPDTDAAAPSLGARLAERHGDDYFVTGFSFARGTFQALRENDDGVFELGAVAIDGPVPGTVDAALAALGEPLAFVDLRAAREDARTADWLAEPRLQFRTGGTYDPDAPEDHLVEYVYADAFDGLCFVAETSRARPLDDAGDVDADPCEDAGGDRNDGDGNDGEEPADAA